MNLRIEQGEIALPKDFKFDIQSNHPFFSDEGTASVPVTVPPSPQNRALLGHPDNQHSALRFIKKLPAQLSHGIYTKRCQLIIDAASRDGGISCSLALQESEMYAAIQDKKLPDVFASEVAISVTSMTNWLNARATSIDPATGYICLPVGADAEDADNPDSTGSTKVVTTVLNKYLESNLRTNMGSITIDDETISVPQYYGIALFMPLHLLLRKIFEYNFYTVETNVFETDPVLSQIVVLHNTADSLVDSYSSGKLYVREKDMVPSMTVGDMVEWIRVKFGAFITVNGKRISIRLLRDVLSMAPSHDLSSFMGKEVTVQHPDPRMLRCSCQYDIDGSEPAAETLEELRARYSSIVNCNDASQLNGTGFFYLAPLGKYYYRQTQNSKLTTAMVGTDGFAYYRKKDIDTEELEADDSFVPMVLHDGAYMPYIGETIRRHIDTRDKETDAEQPLMVVYARTYSSRNYGTLYHYRPNGSEDATAAQCPDLIPEKLAPHFFAAWRDLLLNSAPTMTCKLSIPLSLLSSMDLWTPKLLNHSKVLIKSLKYSISNTGTSACEAELQLLSSFADAEQIANPNPFSSNLAWRVKTTRTVFFSGREGKYENYTRIEGTDGLADYTAADAPTYAPEYPSIKAKARQRWVRVHEHTGYYNWFLDWGTSDTYYTHYYTEYFESYNQE